jgi:hypothetical protein
MQKSNGFWLSFISVARISAVSWNVVILELEMSLHAQSILDQLGTMSLLEGLRNLFLFQKERKEIRVEAKKMVQRE